MQNTKMKNVGNKVVSKKIGFTYICTYFDCQNMEERVLLEKPEETKICKNMKRYGKKS